MSVVAWGTADDLGIVFTEDRASQLIAAGKLLALMTGLAEEAYCESWTDYTSLALWYCAVHAETQPEERDGFGYEQTTRAEARELMDLAQRAGCWWTPEKLMVPLTEWAAANDESAVRA